jgi:hypothetical protein
MGFAMTKRRLFWLAYAACLALTVFWGFRLLAPRHRINRENFDQIRAGMSLEEVTSVFGAPPGDYTKGSYLLFPEEHANWCSGLDSTWGDARWIGNDGAVAVWWGHHLRVRKTEFAQVIRFDAEQTFLEKFRGWLGLEKQRKPLFIFYSPY